MAGLRSRRLSPPRGSFFRVLPNVLTTLALCAGMNAIRFAVQSRWEAAVIAIAVAAVLDTLYGRTARLLNAQSKFGADGDFVTAPELTPLFGGSVAARASHSNPGRSFRRAPHFTSRPT